MKPKFDRQKGKNPVLSCDTPSDDHAMLRDKYCHHRIGYFHWCNISIRPSRDLLRICFTYSIQYATSTPMQRLARTAGIVLVIPRPTEGEQNTRSGDIRTRVINRTCMDCETNQIQTKPSKRP